MMVLSLLSVSSAQTVVDSAVICGGPRLADTLPRDGQTTVPLDIAPVLLWVDACGEGGVLEVVLELNDAEYTVVQEVVVTTAAGEEGMDRITLAEPLLPNTEYWLSVTDGRRTTDVPFTTGSTLTQGAEPPVLLAVEASTSSSNDAWSLRTDVTAEPGADPDGSSLLLLLDQDGQVLDVSLDNPAVLEHEETRLSQPTESCVFLAQEDGRGQRSETVEACAGAVDRSTRGCSTLGLGAGLGLALSGLVLLHRRRRRED